MATINVVNTTLSGQTGTGTFVGNTAPTLSGPISDTIKLTSTSGILDTNGSVILGLSPVGTAVNKFVIGNQPTTGAPILQVQGSDTNVSMQFLAQAAGGFVFTSAALTQPMAIFNGTASQHKTTFTMSNTSANRAVVFQDADGTLAFTAVSGGGTGLASATAYAVLCGGTTSTNPFQSIASVGTLGQVLKSNGAGALPTMQAMNSLKSFTNLSSGSGTYTVPSGVSAIVVEMLAGGGGGGGTAATSATNAAAGGGGAGGYIRTFYGSPAASYSYGIGALGAGGTAGNNAGTAGGNTTFDTFTCFGGDGGAGGAASATAGLGGLGGQGNGSSGGDISNEGDDGYPGQRLITYSLSGYGASTIYGKGGAAIPTTGSSAGDPAVAWGAGGGGASTFGTSTAKAGGNGGSGFITIWEFR